MPKPKTRLPRMCAKGIHDTLQLEDEGIFECKRCFSTWPTKGGPGETVDGDELPPLKA